MERPILFSTSMVQAILQGKKTMTRRVIKRKYDNTHIEWRTDKYGTQLVEMQNNVEGETYWKNPNGTTTQKLLAYRPLKCPYGKPGDILWVRETWQQDPKGLEEFPPEDWWVYKASSKELPEECVKWRPSIFMPKEACRIKLRVTNVRTERLQEITEEDAKAEGIKSYCAEPHRDVPPFIGAAKELGDDLCYTRREAFKQLWDSLNTKRGYGWDTNPWVWVIKFERVKQ